jgi:hypothetical protein
MINGEVLQVHQDLVVLDLKLAIEVKLGAAVRKLRLPVEVQVIFDEKDLKPVQVHILFPRNGDTGGSVRRRKAAQYAAQLLPDV